ncbi:DUF2142 domain-containing protein [Arthrobacter sp. CDRTa11]|uniref:DUF2142 domain-containing protein n=1 Tax=Arthrobacter sp. CDRTa11 TaxID=2651199 RepID=UPI0022658749|nr:DUF2142 domain-containing protein [Arthrobacter sp. CDRTa11]
MISARITRFRAAQGRSWFLPSFLLLLFLSWSWAFASPIASVPDEPAHITKAAAVARGQLGGIQIGTDGPLLAVEVPRYIRHVDAMSCFARDLTSTPTCAPRVDGDLNDTVQALTTAGLYNPIYYAIVGLPSLATSGFPAVYVMRFVSALLSCFFLAAAFGAVSQLRRNKWALITLSAAITPMILFLNGSVNPNSLEYATTAAIAANLLLLLEKSSSGRLPILPIAITTAAASLLANTKALSMLWLLIVVLAVILTATAVQLKHLVKTPAVLAGAGIIALACAFAVRWIIRHDSLSSKPFEGAGMEPADGAEIMLDKVFNHMIGWIGQFGWLELDAPLGVLALWMAIIFVVTLSVLLFTRGRARIAALLLALSLIALPIVLQAQIISEQGIIWQGRYILAIFVPFMLFAGVALDRSLTGTIPAPGRRALNTVVNIAIFAQIFTFVWVLRRYTTGLSLDIRWAEMLEAPKWQPPLGIVAVVVIFSATSVIAAALLKRHINSTDDLPVARGNTEPATDNTESLEGNPEPVAGTAEPVAATRRRLRVSRGQDDLNHA